MAAVLKLTTDVASRVSISVNDGSATWERHFYDYGTSHSLPLLGFKPGRTNRITVTVRDRNRNTAIAPPLTFNTMQLPNNFPRLALVESKPAKMEPGYTLCRIVAGGSGTDYLTILNNAGEVVWYSGDSSNAASVDVRQLENGNLFFPRKTNFVEVTLLGATVKSWGVPTGFPLDFHDGVPTDHGTILYLSAASQTVSNFPSSSTNANAPLQTARVEYDRIIEISATNGAVLNVWSLAGMLDPRRIDYLTFRFTTANGWDGQHANAVIEDPRDDSIIVSVRNQDAVIKFSRATGQLKWILGPHENWKPEYQAYLLTPVGAPFQWQYAQHAPMLTPNGTLLLYDNGNYRASPFDVSVPDQSNYSHAVEYRIDEEKMEVSRVWEYGVATSERIFTPTVGDANWLPQHGNVLITFGSITYIDGVHPSATAPNANMARIKEVTHDPVPEVVFDLAVFDYTNSSSGYRGNWVYRSTRIPDLYAHPAMPVGDLIIKFENNIARMEFSADAAHAYFVEKSTDLIEWQEIGEAQLEETGEFGFTDPYTHAFPMVFYRVFTK